MPTPLETPKKSRWGIGIAIVYGIFMLAAVGAVVASRFQRNDLVARDYYEQEIKYQDHIDRITRTSDMKQHLDFRFDRGANQLAVTFPGEIAAERISGKITLYFPANAGYDRTVAIAIDANHQQRLDCRRLPRGHWRIKCLWQIDAHELYSEGPVILE